MWKFLNRVNVEDGQGEEEGAPAVGEVDVHQPASLVADTVASPKTSFVRRSLSSQTKEFENIIDHNANVSEIKEDTSYQIESPFLKLRKINSNNLQGNYLFPLT